MYDLTPFTQRWNQYQTSKDLFTESGYANLSFDTPHSPPSPQTQAIWTDLLVIEQSPRPEILINAWQSMPSSGYDFSLGRDKIVVKYSLSEDRTHSFTLDQLRPPVHAHVLVASTVLREADSCSSGMSLKDLYARIRLRVSAADSLLRLYTIIAHAVGDNRAQFEDVQFDYSSAVDYLEFYEGADIPCIDRKYIPLQVSDVSFSSNLSGLVDVRQSERAAELMKSPLFRGLV